MPRPPTARAGETAFASVVWQWWKEVPPSDQLARDSHEIAPTEVGLPTIERSALTTITIDTSFPPRLSLIIFAGLAEHGGADIEQLVYETDFEPDSQWVQTYENRTVLSVDGNELPDQMAIAVVQARWTVPETFDDWPQITCTWAGYIDQ